MSYKSFMFGFLMCAATVIILKLPEYIKQTKQIEERMQANKEYEEQEKKDKDALNSLTTPEKAFAFNCNSLSSVNNSLKCECIKEDFDIAYIDNNIRQNKFVSCEGLKTENIKKRCLLVKEFIDTEINLSYKEYYSKNFPVYNTCSFRVPDISALRFYAIHEESKKNETDKN